MISKLRCASPADPEYRWPRAETLLRAIYYPYARVANSYAFVVFLLGVWQSVYAQIYV